MTTHQTEAEFLQNYTPNKYPSVAVTSDIAIFTIRGGKLSVLLIERGGHPYQGCWALPGGFVGENETSDEAAARELEEETGIAVSDAALEQLRTYSTPGRDPRMRVVSVGYIAIMPDMPLPVSGDDARDAHWFAVEDLNLDGTNPDGITLAFDHNVIIADALERVRAKFEYTPLATRFLDDTFTLPDLRRVYESVWGKELHASNFRRKVLSTPGFVTPTGGNGPAQIQGRNAALYRAGDAVMLHPALMRE